MQNSSVQSIVHKAAHYFDAASLQEVTSAASECEGSFTQLEKAVIAGDKKQKDVAIQRILKNKSVKICALIVAQSSKAEARTHAELLNKLPAMNFQKDCRETIVTFLKTKDGSIPLPGSETNEVVSQPTQSYRQICEFGHIRRARDWVVRRILEILSPRHPSNFRSRGWGTEELSDHIKKLGWGKKKHTVRFILFDIKNYYPSVRQNQEVVEMLGLPNCLVRFDIFTSPDAPVVLRGILPHGVSKEVFIGAAREGLPQGKATSSLVADILFGWVLEQLVPAHRFSFYGDDGAIACNNDGEKMADALRGAMKSHPAGPFQLKHCFIGNFKDGFSHVKYHYQITSFKDGIRRAPSATSFERFKNRVATIAEKSKPNLAPVRAYAYSLKWRRSFRRWKVSKRADEKIVEKIKEGLILAESRTKP